MTCFSLISKKRILTWLENRVQLFVIIIDNDTGKDIISYVVRSLIYAGMKLEKSNDKNKILLECVSTQK